MPYSSVWDTNGFPGSSAAKTIDDEIRKLRRQLEDRFEDVLIEDITADPWVLKGAISGLKTGIKRIIPFAAFLNDLHARENDISLTGFLIGFVGNDMAAPLGAYIPVGCVITKLRWLVNKDAAASIDGKIYSRPFVNTAPAHTIINTTNIAAAGANVVASVDLAIEILPDVMYWLGIIGNGAVGNSYHVYGCEVTFNRPSVEQAT